MLPDKRACLLVLSFCISAFGATNVTASRPAAQPPDDFFPYGAMHFSTISHWQHYLPPVEEWAAWIEKDIAAMKQVGMNTMAAHVDWYDIEVAPGKYDFSRLDRLVEILERHKMRALLWPWPELQPDWVAREHPGSEWLAADGYKPGPACWDDPAVRVMIERFIRTVVARYRNRPSVLAWDVAAEAGIWVAAMGPPDQSANPRLYCYCAHTVNRYREWLRGKYGSLGKLNETWATYYTDWSEVQPVRAGIFERSQPVYLDWRQFMLDNTTSFQQLKADAARASDPLHPITAHIGGWGSSYVHQCTDEYSIARHFDVFSLSFFPFWMEWGYGFWDPALGAMQLDGTRSASGGKPMWVEEMQGGPSIYGLKYRSRFPTPQDVRLWVWQAVAHGATGIFYWNWRPETTGIEAGGFGLVNQDGSLTDRARAAGDVGLELQKHARRLLASRSEPAQIAILHDPRTFLLSAAEQDGGVYTMSIRGVYRALFDANIPVDLIVPQQLHAMPLDRYKLLCVPFGYVLSRADGQRIADYVRSGGTLVAGLFCGMRDERAFIYESVPGAGLDKVLHVRQEQVGPAPVEPMHIVRQDAATASLPVGAELPVRHWQERFAVGNGGRVLAEFADKSPAIVAGEYGRGRTLYIGTLLPVAYDQKPTANTAALLTGLAAWAGVRPAVTFRIEPPGAKVEARALETADGQRTIVLLNNGWNPAEVSTAIRQSAAPSSTRIFDLLTGDAIVTQGNESELTAKTTVPGREARVIAVDQVR